MEDGTLLSRLLRSASAVSLPVHSLSLASSKSTPALASMDVPLPALPCLKQGQLLIEVDGVQGQWEAYDVALVGNDITNLSLVYGKNDQNLKPRLIRLHSASIDLMEEIFSIITKEKTWYLCAQSQKEAEEWADAICTALESAAINSSTLINDTQRRRLSSHVTASTVKEIQTRDIFTRLDEFLEIYVRSDLHDIHRQATRGALSWSCLRNLMWRVWLGILPGTTTFDQWVPITTSSRELYTNYQQQYRFILPSSLDEDDIHYCSCPSPTNTTALLHSIYRDVIRTRCSMPYFREPHIQTMMIRILYIYAQVHPRFGYHQGMGELLAVFVYLLYIEQYPRDEQGSPRDGRWSFEAVPVDASWDDQSYVHVDKMDAPKISTYLDKQRFLSSVPFVINESTPTTSCKEAVIDILSTVTSGEFIEHDAFFLFEKLMERMDGFFSTANESTIGLHVQLEHVQFGLLSQLDPEVALHFNTMNLLPEVYLVKWVRLLFAREFPMYQVWVLWDAIFSVSSDNLSFVHYLCVAMLHEMRDEILLQDDASGIIECMKKANVSFTKIVDKAREMHERILIDEAIAMSQSIHKSGPV
ncbi:hypothetical protein THRCLA_11312 [Thraustotheca clavata]|uniref:Rab-GAP TBC domain-containing protein n=1 Tax=Thraustotheca clavata TaxID=74557 RepID=A0A1V9Y846_9STRA|nr:hypothetical protein THRCLA_11312 [Thraustotheca clavata]